MGLNQVVGIMAYKTQIFALVVRLHVKLDSEFKFPSPCFCNLKNDFAWSKAH